MRRSTPMRPGIVRLALVVLAASAAVAAVRPGPLPVGAGARPIDAGTRAIDSTSHTRSTQIQRIPAQSPDQGTALPQPGTPIPTPDILVAGTLWLPYVVLSRPQVIPRPTLRISPTPRATGTSPGTLEPATPPPTAPATVTVAPPTPTRTAVPSTAVPPTDIPSTATASPTVASPSATPLLCIVAEREPNNAILEALDQPPLCPDQPGSGALPEGDVTDYFRLQLSAPGLIVADLGTLPAGTNYDLYLYTRQGQLLAISQLPDNQAEHVEARVTVAGDYYARVYASSGRSAEAYTVSWTLQP